MSDQGFVVAVPRTVSLPVAGADQRFPVRRIYCVGRNYAEHIREMGGDEARDPPVFFQKPADSIVEDGGIVPYPPMTSDLHYELELVVALKGGGFNLPPARALDQVYGYAIGIDMTRRDRQRDMGKGGLPWEIGKSFDHSCPCGPVHPAERTGHIQSGAIRLMVDGTLKQDSDIGLMIWKVPEIIANLSNYFELLPGDIILTGTPHGVGPVVPGNELVGSIEGLGTLTVRIGPQATQP
jgi:fumarylpyruvate hydrolase